MKGMIALALLACLGGPGDDGWKALFNGKDLEGWDVYVGPGKGHPARGLNNDPDGVFTVGEIDGAPAMHVTGQTIGWPRPSTVTYSVVTKRSNTSRIGLGSVAVISRSATYSSPRSRALQAEVRALSRPR